MGTIDAMSDIESPDDCPCGSGSALKACCGPIISGEVEADTAEVLMRARYTAYATAEIDFILSTHDPDTADKVDPKSTEAWAKGSTWLGLEIVSTTGGGARPAAIVSLSRTCTPGMSTPNRFSLR